MRKTSAVSAVKKSPCFAFGAGLLDSVAQLLALLLKFGDVGGRFHLVRREHVFFVDVVLRLLGEIGEQFLVGG